VFFLLTYEHIMVRFIIKYVQEVEMLVFVGFVVLVYCLAVELGQIKKGFSKGCNHGN
jgi:hypothetical protein